MTMTKFYTADLHHKHKNICKMTNRNLVVDKEQHDEWLIAVWNTQVKRGDLIYILGDVSFSRNIDEIGDWLSKLNGQKIVIKGNHDRNNILEELCIRNVIQNWFSYHETKIGSTKTCMMHFPIACWNQQGRGSYHIHGHCVDDETEILTKNGWKYIKECNIGDIIYSRNPVLNSLEEHPITEIITNNFTGKVYSYKGKSVNFRVTDMHTLVGYGYTGVYFEKPIKNITGVFKVNTSCTSEKAGINLSKELLQLYICIVADGSIKKATNLCRIKVKKEHKKVFLNNLFSTLNIEVNEYSKNEYISFNFYIPNELLDFNFKGLDRKLLDLNKTQCQYIIEAYCNSDGHRQQNGVTIYSAKQIEIDLLQQIFVINGFMATKHERYHGFSNNKQYQLSVTLNQLQIVQPKRFIIEHVENEIFRCIKVTNSNFIARRCGKVHITGNCHGSYKGNGKILDVGLDNAYNLFGEHRLLTEEDIVEYMNKQEIYASDHHKIIKEN